MPNITDTVTTPDGTCTVRLFTPDGEGPWPGVVMYPDAGGVRKTLEEMAAKLADFGYAVLLPDVYYRLGDWAPIDMKTAFGDPEERKRLMSMIGTVTPMTMAIDAGADLHDLAHEFMPKNIALVHLGNVAVIKMQIRPTDSG